MDRKIKYQEIHTKDCCCPDRYVLAVDVPHPYSGDQGCVIKYNYEEYIKGKLVTEGIEYF